MCGLPVKGIQSCTMQSLPASFDLNCFLVMRHMPINNFNVTSEVCDVMVFAHIDVVLLLMATHYLGIKINVSKEWDRLALLFGKLSTTSVLFDGDALIFPILQPDFSILKGKTFGHSEW